MTMKPATALLRPLIPFACAALIACGPTPPETAQQPRRTSSGAPAPAHSPAPAERVASLAGEWRVAAIDGRPSTNLSGSRSAATTPRCGGSRLAQASPAAIGSRGGCLLLADGPLESVMLYRLTSTPRRRSMRRTPLLAPLAMEDGYK